MKARDMGIKSLLFLALIFFSFTASAMYIGNPHRPNTIWVPGHYVNGCWMEGYYMKFVNPVIPGQLVWVAASNGHSGYWMPTRFIIINSPM